MKRRSTVKRFFSSASMLLVGAVFVIQSATPAGATNLIDLLNQGIDYYIPGDVCGTTGTDIPANSTLPEAVIAAASKNKAMYEAAAKQVDLPWQVLAGIHYRESNFDLTHDLQAGNPIGGPYNQASTSYAKYGYPKTIEESVVIAGKELQDKAQAGLFHKKITVSAIDTELIKDALFGYNGRAAVYAQQAARLGFDPVKQPYEGSPYVMSRYDALHTDMQIITHDFGGLDGIDKRFGAFAVYALLGGPKNGTGTAGSSCQQSAAGQGDLQKIILSYAWPEYHRPVYMTRKPEYVKAIQAAVAKGEYVGACDGVDCGGFITRVMRDSGLDPNYNKYQSNTDAQWQYLRENTTMYQHLTNVNDSTGTKNLLLGDIAVNGHHTYMYVGKIPGFNGNSASASLCERSPMASNAYGFSEFEWYRLIKPATPPAGSIPIGGP